MTKEKTPAQKAAQSRYVKSRATISIVLNPELKAKIAECAKQVGVSQAEFIRRALEQAVQEVKRIEIE